MSEILIVQSIEAAKNDVTETFQRQPEDFFTESDITAFFLGRIHHRLQMAGHKSLLAHMEYPTPFRCSMAHGKFCVKSETERSEKGKLHTRGHFDVVVLNPEFVTSCRYNVRKGQNWGKLREFLNQDNPFAAYYVFELMFLRDQFLRDVSRKRGKETMNTVAKMIKQDWEKAQYALQPMETGYIFSQKAEMLLFTNSLCISAIDFLKDLIPKEVSVISTCRHELRAVCKRSANAAKDERSCFWGRGDRP